MTFTHLNSHADPAPVTMVWHEQSAAAGLKLTEITRGKGKWSVGLMLSFPGHEIEVKESAELAEALCCNMKRRKMSVCLAIYFKVLMHVV